MFGDDMLVAPVTSPMKEGYATVKVWLPEGTDWYEWATGTLLKGGQVVERAFALDEYPVYVKAGAILPFYGTVKNLRYNDEAVRLTVFPGGNGSFSFYEDNGNDQLYKDQYARTQLSSEWKENKLTVHVGQRKGSYKDMPQKRTYCVDVVGSVPADKVLVNGKPVEAEYDGTSLTLTVDLPACDCTSDYTVEVFYKAGQPEVNNGLYGQFKRMKKSFVDMRYRNASIDYIQELGDMETTGRAVTYHTDSFADKIRQYQANYANLPELLKKQGLSDNDAQWFLQSVRWEKK